MGDSTELLWAALKDVYLVESSVIGSVVQKVVEMAVLLAGHLAVLTVVWTAFGMAAMKADLMAAHLDHVTVAMMVSAMVVEKVVGSAANSVGEMVLWTDDLSATN